MTAKTWHEETVEMLLASPMTTREVADATGINKHWVAGLKKGQFADPGVGKIERLYRFFKTPAKKKG